MNFFKSFQEQATNAVAAAAEMAAQAKQEAMSSEVMRGAMVRIWSHGTGHNSCKRIIPTRFLTRPRVPSSVPAMHWQHVRVTGPDYDTVAAAAGLR